MSKPVFLKGALALSISAFISKLLGLFYVIPLKHFAGDEGLALYQAVFPIYNTLLILSVSGIPIALSMLISEKLAEKKDGEIAGILSSAWRIMLMVSVIGFVLLYLGAPRISEWIGNSDTILSIQALSLAMLVVPFVALLRGYFYGYQRMSLSASSQVLEQLVRVCVMIGLVYWYMKEGRDMAVVASGAAMGSFAGVAVSLFLLVFLYIRSNDGSREKKGRSTEGLGFAKKILTLSIPISVSSLMLPLLGMADSMTIINLLKEIGFGEADATIQSGIYSRGVPIVQFAAFYATGLSVAVVPALAASRTVGEKTKHIYKTVQIAFLIGLPSSIGMMLISSPLNILFYGNSQGSHTLAVLSASSFFLSMSIVLAGILQGLSKQTWPAVYLAIGIIIKILANRFLISHFGIDGAAYATVITYAIMAWLCLLAINGFHRQSRSLLKEIPKWMMPTLLMGMAVWAGLWLGEQWIPLELDRRVSLFFVSSCILVGLISYGIGLILFRIVSWRESALFITNLLHKGKKSGVSISSEYDIAHIREKKDGKKRE